MSRRRKEFVPRCPGCGRPYGWTRLIRGTLCDVCLIRRRIQ